MLHLHPIFSAFYARATNALWSPETAKYAAEQGLDMARVNAVAGTFLLTGCIFDGRGRFNIGGETRSVVIEALAEDGVTVLDLVAWPADDPGKFATALGTIAVLGANNITKASTWALGGLLSVHRTPLSWLKACGQGVVILDHRYAPHDLGEALGPLLGEDQLHAAQLRKMLCRPPVAPKQILFRRDGKAIA